ncbi:MAG TPA: LamG domain-containing protein [Planctomycetota bacterium]|nr:LamG domain-containing protein [Planctomycetota bacterium]
MGKSIVYCDGCGKSLPEDEFTRGKAHFVDERPFCVSCKPLPEPPPARPPTPSPLPKKIATSRISIPAAGTRRIPLPPRPARRPAARTIGIAAAAAVAGGMILVLALSGGSSRATPAPPPPAREPAPRPPSRDEAARAAVEELERLAASGSPDEILLACDRVRRTVEGTRYAPRLRQVEENALRRRAERRTDADRFLGQIRELIQADREFTRQAELEGMIAAALRTWPDRRGDIDLLRADYERRRAEAARRASLAGHWKFDDGGGDTATDASDYAHHARVLGGPQWTTGRIGGALRFDGKDDVVVLPGAAPLNRLQEGSFTLAAWFKALSEPTGPDGDNRSAYAIVVKQGWHEGLSYRPGRTFYAEHWLAGDVWVQTSASAPSFVPGAFFHVAMVVRRETGRLELYVDGILRGSASFTPGAPTRDYGATPWRIGCANPGADKWAWPAHGVIDDVRLYSRALAPEEILELRRVASQ